VYKEKEEEPSRTPETSTTSLSKKAKKRQGKWRGRHQRMVLVHINY
jgi:hypothetical protein